jgi:hypothetical protein
VSAPGLSAVAARIRAFILRPSEDEAAFAGLALALFRLQAVHNAACARLLAARGLRPETVQDWRAIPAVPAVAFKEAELTALPPAARTAVFHSSGTTLQRPGRHFHGAESLALYEASLRAALAPRLLPEGGRPAVLSLTPPPAAAPHSSLAHMLGVVVAAHGGPASAFLGRAGPEGWTVDLAAALTALEKAAAAGAPVLLAGTAFNFVHLLEAFAAAGRRLALPPGSRIMETGGYKGRSRELPKAELHAALAAALGVPDAWIVGEYGMSELGSQAYDRTAGHGGPRLFRFPPWARASVISPETGREVDDGGTGRLRVLDLANVWSVVAVQTDDLAVRRGAGFELLGRAPAAEPRGCSLLTPG